VRRVIIFAPNWLGDAVMALPAIADVRHGSSGATLAVAAQPSVAPLFTMVPAVDEILSIHRGVRPIFFRQRMSGRRDRNDAESAILLPNSFRSALIAWRAGIGERSGYRTDLRGPLLTRAVDPPPPGTHQVDAYQRLVQALGFARARSGPHLDVPSDARTAAACLLKHAGWDGRRPIAVIAPGAAFGVAKQWPPRSFAAVARKLADDGLQPVMVGSAADTPTGTEIESAVEDPGTVLNVIGRTDLPTLAGVLAGARVLLSNDSGAMHLGAALGVPVAALFGPTDERVVAPRPPAHAPASCVLTHAVWCRPCWLRECPLDHECMRGISVETVVQTARQLI
jgi:lipopolysaccharide heptosyltransferase II